MESNDTAPPRLASQAVLDQALKLADADVKTRFGLVLASDADGACGAGTCAAGRRGGRVGRDAVARARTGAYRVVTFEHHPSAEWRGAAMGTPIPGLRGTPTHELAVGIYQGHDDDGSGCCARCGDRAPCEPRRHAASVISAAGEDPLWYDRRLPREVPAPAQPDHAGYRVGGRGVPTDPASYLYSRESE